MSAAIGIPPERLRALVRLIGDQDMTPVAARQLNKLADEYDDLSDIERESQS